MAKRNFKSILSLIVSLALVMSIMSLPFTASAAVIENSSLVELIDDGDFTKYEIGTDISAQAGWGDANAAGGKSSNTKTVISAEGKDGSTTNVLEVRVKNTADASNSSFRKDVEVQTAKTGVYVLSFDAKAVKMEGSVGFQIQLNKTAELKSGSKGSLVLRNTFTGKGDGISFKESPSEKICTDTVTSVGRWYNYKIVYNCVNRKAALYIDDAEVLPFEEMAANAVNLDQIRCIGFVLPRTNKAEDNVIFDNISFTYQSMAEYDAVKTLPDSLVYENKNLTLPTAGITGSAITWESSDPSVITSGGGVIPSTEEDKTVTLTATVNDTVSTPVAVSYSVTIPKAESAGALDAANANTDAEAITLPEYTGQAKLTLPTTGSVYGSEITWESDSAVINTEDGTITLPKETTVVTLTATIRNGEAEVTKEFTYKFYAKGTVLNEDFSYPSVEGSYDVINGFNGWSATEEDDGGEQVKTTTATVSGEKLIFKQVYDANPATYSIRKDFPLVTNGKANFSMEVVIPEDHNFKLNASGLNLEVGGLQINLRFSRYRVKTMDGSWGSYVTIAGVDDAEGSKFTLKVAMNLDTSKATVSVNGVPYINEYDLGALNYVSVSPMRIQSFADAATAAEFSVDNINIIHKTSKVQIADLSFVDADGNAVIGRTDGGKLSAVTVAALDEDIPSVHIIAAVYEADGKTIKSIAVGDKTDLDKDVSNVITFENPAELPEADAENAVIKIFAWNDKLATLNLSPYVYTKTGQQIKFVVCGDSISCNYNPSKTNIVGMGMELGGYFDSEKVSILNIAKSGASTKSFYDDRQELQNNLGSINSGDYVLLMFGHNDSSKAEKGTTPEEYKSYLTKMINLVRTKGAIPVLLSPVVRCIWNEDGATLDNSSLKVYTDAMYELSQELNIKYVDVNTATKNLIEGYGKDSEEANAFYLLDRDYEAGLVTEYEYDTTHLTKTGASIVAGIVAEAFEENGWLPNGYYIGE